MKKQEMKKRLRAAGIPRRVIEELLNSGKRELSGMTGTRLRNRRAEDARNNPVRNPETLYSIAKSNRKMSERRSESTAGHAGRLRMAPAEGEAGSACCSCIPVTVSFIFFTCTSQF
ncbi:MAG: hypothetical protein NC131_18540 [Roseburia sp.]|nr:hypothetical protein [Roseburia sp.]